MDRRTIDYIASAQVKRNLRNSALVEAARSLPFCKRNILLSKIIYWDRIYCRLISAIMDGNPLEGVELNINDKCIDYVQSHNLVNPKFADFFFNFHEPLTLAFLRKMRVVLNNGMPLGEKFDYIATEVTELLNIAYIELDGLDISCSIFGDEPICIKEKQCAIADCTDPSNIFFCMMNEEYKLETGLFEEILKVAVEHLAIAKEPIIMIVDYKNMNQSGYVFGPKARARYDFCKQGIEEIYFYNYQGLVEFGPEFEGLEHLLIPDKKSLKTVIKNWKEKKIVTRLGV